MADHLVRIIHLFAEDSRCFREPKRAYQTKVPTDSDGKVVSKNVSRYFTAKDFGKFAVFETTSTTLC